MKEETIQISRDVAERLRADIEAYKSADPSDDEGWTKMLDHLDSIHEHLDLLLEKL